MSDCEDANMCVMDARCDNFDVCDVFDEYYDEEHEKEETTE